MPVLLPVLVCSKSSPNLTHACSTKFFIIHMRCVFVWAGVVRPTSSGRASCCSLPEPIVTSAEPYDGQRTSLPTLMAEFFRDNRKPRKHQADATQANPAKGPAAHQQHNEPCPEVLIRAVLPGLVRELHPET